MRKLLVLTVLAASCAGDNTIAIPTQIESAPVTPAPADPDDDGVTDPDDPGATPGAGSGGDPDVAEPGPDASPSVDVSAPAPDAGPTVEPGGNEEDPDAPWSPDWVEDAPAEIKGCLEAFPMICAKVDECGQEQPILGLISGFCPTAFDALSPVLTMGCEQIGPLLDQAVPGGIPFVGDVSELVQKLLKGCIENFQCDPAYLQQFGESLLGIVQTFTQSQQDGGQADIMSALPALLDLANQCGGIGDLLGIPFFGP